MPEADEGGLLPASRLTPERNARVFLAVALVIVAGIVALVLVLGSSSVAPPAAGAATVVPGDALLYFHVSTDTTRPTVRDAIRIAGRLPDLPLAAQAVTTRLDEVLTGGATSVDFSAQVLPWLGREAAFALLNTQTSTAGSLIILGVRNRARAAAFVVNAGAAPAGAYRGTNLLRYASGTTVAFVRGYLVVGQRASVKAAIDVARGSIQSLAASSPYRRAAAGEPDDRVIDAYLSASGVRRVLAAQGGLLGALGVLLYQPALLGTTIALSPSADGLRLRIHGALDPTLASLSGAPGSGFEPTLAGVVPAGTTLFLDVKGLAHVAPRVLNAGAEGGIAGRIGPLLRRLGAALAAEGVDVSQITQIFSGETAVAVAPPGSGPSRKKGSASASSGAALVIVAHTAHEQQTRRALAALEAPLAQLFPPPSTGPGQAPEFNDIPVAGVTVHQLALAPGLEFDYAVFRGLVVFSTSLRAVSEIARHAQSLQEDPGYAATLADHPNRVTSLVFLDFSQLLRLAEQTGLTHSARLVALRPDLDKIRAIGLASTRGENDTTAELSLQIP